MKHRMLLLAATCLSTAALASAALAETVATAATDLNMRAGPGPQYEIVGLIKGNDTATVQGCIEGSLWCRVSYEGKQGWAYSRYLSAPISGETVVISERPTAVPVIEYERPAQAAGATGGATGGAVTGAIAGAIIAGPLGAAVGGATGALAGGATGVVAGGVTPPPAARTYVIENPVDQVYLDGEVVVGATLPPAVELRPVPDSEFDYAYVNRVPVLVQRGERRIVYVYR